MNNKKVKFTVYYSYVIPTTQILHVFAIKGLFLFICSQNLNFSFHILSYFLSYLLFYSSFFHTRKYLFLSLFPVSVYFDNNIQY